MAYQDISHDDYSQYLDTRQVSPSIRRPDSPYAVLVTVVGKEPKGQFERTVEVLLSPDDALRLAGDLIQKARSLMEEKQWMKDHPAVEPQVAR